MELQVFFECMNWYALTREWGPRMHGLELFALEMFKICFKPFNSRVFCSWALKLLIWGNNFLQKKKKKKKEKEKKHMWLLVVFAILWSIFWRTVLRKFPENIKELGYITWHWRHMMQYLRCYYDSSLDFLNVWKNLILKTEYTLTKHQRFLGTMTKTTTTKKKKKKKKKLTDLTEWEFLG